MPFLKQGFSTPLEPPLHKTTPLQPHSLLTTTCPPPPILVLAIRPTLDTSCPQEMQGTSPLPGHPTHIPEIGHLTARPTPSQARDIDKSASSEPSFPELAAELALDHRFSLCPVSTKSRTAQCTGLVFFVLTVVWKSECRMGMHQQD